MKIDQPLRRVARSPTFVARVAPSGARMQTRLPSITSRLASHAIRLIRWRVSSNDHCHSPFARIAAAYAARASVYRRNTLQHRRFRNRQYILACRAVAREPGDIGEAEAPRPQSSNTRGVGRRSAGLASRRRHSMTNAAARPPHTAIPGTSRGEDKAQPPAQRFRQRVARVGVEDRCE
jgi:hypothetical protein